MVDLLYNINDFYSYLEPFGSVTTFSYLPHFRNVTPLENESLRKASFSPFTWLPKVRNRDVH